jgi:hypothetical protein
MWRRPVDADTVLETMTARWGEAMPVPLIKFRRCPECRRTEIVETSEVIAAGNQRHDRCRVGVENWVYFEAPADWRPV